MRSVSEHDTEIVKIRCLIFEALSPHDQRRSSLNTCEDGKIILHTTRYDLMCVRVLAAEMQAISQAPYACTNRRGAMTRLREINFNLHMYAKRHPRTSLVLRTSSSIRLYSMKQKIPCKRTQLKIMMMPDEHKLRKPIKCSSTWTVHVDRCTCFLL